MVKAYVFPKDLVSMGHKYPRFVWMKSIYKDQPPALIHTAGLQQEEGFIEICGDKEIYRKTEWGTICKWCEKKYYLGNMLIIVDEDGIKSVMCPSCYKKVVS